MYSRGIGEFLNFHGMIKIHYEIFLINSNYSTFVNSLKLISNIMHLNFVNFFNILIEYTKISKDLNKLS